MEDTEYWDKQAQAYDTFIGDEGDLLRKCIIDPYLISHVLPNKKDTILDAGCGNGYLTRKLSPFCDRVIGVDGSKPLIEIAKSKPKEYTNNEFIFLNLTHVPWKLDQSFTKIIAHLILQDIDPIDTVLSEFHNHLFKNGNLYITLPHPFTSPPTGRYRRGILGRLGLSHGFLHVTDYLSHRKAKRTIYLHKELEHNYYHRTISAYLNQIIQSGFAVEDIDEIGVTQDFAKKHPQYRHGITIPIFLYIHCKKL